MKRIGLSILAAWLLASCAPALAQTPQLGRLCVGTAASCIPVSVANPFPVSGTFSATLGGFLPSLSYGTLTATAASSASTALPTNTGTVAFQNQNAVAVSCTLAAGAATATTNEIIVPAGSTVFVATTGYDHAACINQTGSASNVIAMAGGSGLGTGFGGGSSGGGGLSVTDQAAWTQASSAFTPGGGVFNDAATLSSGQEGTFRMTTKRAQIMDVDTSGNALYSAITAPIPAGTNTIGNVGADPSSGKATPTEAFLALPATTTTQIVALSGSTKTYVTSAVVLAGGTVNVTFKYGTGSNCGTGTTTLNGPWPLTAQAGFSKGSGLGAVMIVPAGQALCITTDASVTGGVDLTYQQF